jgi:hypothetical protein
MKGFFAGLTAIALGLLLLVVGLWLGRLAGQLESWTVRAAVVPLCAGVELTTLLAGPRPPAMGARVLVGMAAAAAMGAPAVSYIAACSLFVKGRRRERIVGGLLLGLLGHALWIPSLLILATLGSVLGRVTDGVSLLLLSGMLACLAVALEIARTWVDLAVHRHNTAADARMENKIERTLSEADVPPVEVIVAEGKSAALSTAPSSGVLKLTSAFVMVLVLAVVGRNTVLSPIAGGAIVIAAGFVREFFLTWHVRSQEREADRDAARLAGPSNVIGMLQALAEPFGKAPVRSAIDPSVWTTHGTVADREKRMLALQGEAAVRGSARSKDGSEQV